ncbi:hypothetical protein HMPREF1092_01237 [Clostridium thermobutyricum]|uniref:Uncharacterized protein n=1 Tax=Clostridium thermobutyricum TaxID=29372 RepID=N9Y2D4_9CLOT|nr:hypothetical protein [Clostridium thermobutyricum]ENZ02002.1 hypothetical protein HMPREF1092_01237 [Clostridium thermobutyricum]
MGTYNKITNIKIRIDIDKKEVFRMELKHNNSNMTEVITKFINNYIPKEGYGINYKDI